MTACHSTTLSPVYMPFCHPFLLCLESLGRPDTLSWMKSQNKLVPLFIVGFLHHQFNLPQRRLIHLWCKKKKVTWARLISHILDNTNLATETGYTLNAFCWLAGCLTSLQHASVSHERIRLDRFRCCHTEKELLDQTFYLTQAKDSDIGPTSPSTNPVTLGA